MENNQLLFLLNSSTKTNLLLCGEVTVQCNVQLSETW
jgi:hypothetical protein